MKTTKIIFLVLIFSFIFAAAESFAYPRRIIKICKVTPRMRVTRVVYVQKPVIVVKKYHKKHFKKRIIYYY
jgi:hypothetical protein